MKESLFIVCIVGTFTFGYFLMDQLDLFLTKNRKAPEGQKD